MVKTTLAANLSLALTALWAIAAHDKIPFWEALEHIGERTGRTVSVVGVRQGLWLAKRSVHPSLINVKGPFRLEVTRFHEDRDIDFAQMGKERKPRRDYLLTLTV